MKDVISISEYVLFYLIFLDIMSVEKVNKIWYNSIYMLKHVCLKIAKLLKNSDAKL